MTDTALADPAPAAPEPVAAPAPVAAAPAQPASPAAPVAPVASWRDSLPDALRNDEILSRYESVEAVAQGLVEAQRQARSRYNSDEGIRAFGDANRPQDAAAYEIPVIEGGPTSLADSYRQFAHEIGMPPAWAKAHAEWLNQITTADIEAANRASQADVDGFKSEFVRQFGENAWDAKVKAGADVLKQFGVQLDEQDLAQLDAKLGSSNLIKFLFEVSDRVGDPKPIGVETGGAGMPTSMTPDQAKARYDQAIKDSDWRTKAKQAGTQEHAEYLRLNALISAGKRTAQRPL